MSLKSKDFLPNELLDQEEDFKDDFLSDDIKFQKGWTQKCCSKQDAKDSQQRSIIICYTWCTIMSEEQRFLSEYNM